MDLRKEMLTLPQKLDRESESHFIVQGCPMGQQG